MEMERTVYRKMQISNRAAEPEQGLNRNAETKNRAASPQLARNQPEPSHPQGCRRGEQDPAQMQKGLAGKQWAGKSWGPEPHREVKGES